MSEEQLTTEQRQELYTLMGQWSRNTDLQFQQVADWTDKQLAQVCEQREKERDDCVMLLKAVIAKNGDLQCLREKIVDYLQRKGLTSVLR